MVEKLHSSPISPRRETAASSSRHFIRRRHVFRLVVLLILLCAFEHLYCDIQTVGRFQVTIVIKQPSFGYWKRNFTFVLEQRRAFDRAKFKPVIEESGDGATNVTLTLNDFPDLTEDDFNEDTNSTTLSWDEALVDREPLLDIVQRAGVQIDTDVLQVLPKWSEIRRLYGKSPVVVNKESCKVFQERVPQEKRFVGVAGQMNSGTNALARYLSDNLILSENTHNSRGILKTVPWYKHGWAGLRNKYKYSFPEEHENVLPVIVIRDPYFWMQSMCQSPYNLKWNFTADHCPNLVKLERSTKETGAFESHDGIEVSVEWKNSLGDTQVTRSWQSLAHVWSTWYEEYLFESDFPFLMIRFEDLLLHTEAVVSEIKDCVGAEWKEDNFVYSPDPVKKTRYFESFKAQSGLISALIKYGRDGGRRKQHMTDDDVQYSSQYLNENLLRTFHYIAPDEKDI